ncbi:MAG: hypothetical protein GF311_26725, partial [Candidatus Lokiarchaeota archaeon]|nr:hypothetical protein [Candidatus Lokiarchaeota archaeon]
LLVYVIDIQDRERFESSLHYFDSIVQYFIENEMDVPIIVTFHKYDPEVRTYEEINEDIMKLKEKIEETYPSFNILFQQTSIYDVISIVQLISYGLSVFDNKFFELSLLLETHLGEFDCTSLVLFDKNGIIISEFYNDSIDPTIYTHLIESIKEHLFILKRMDEEEFLEDHNFFSIENDIISYLHQIYANDEKFFISILIKEDKKEPFLLKFSEFRDQLTNILESLTS